MVPGPVKNDTKIVPKLIFGPFWETQGAQRSKHSEKVCFFWRPLGDPEVSQKSENASKIGPLQKHYKGNLKSTQNW